MHFLINFSITTWILLILLCIVISLFLLIKKNAENGENNKIELNGPFPFPIIGSLHLLAGYRIPFEAFQNLAITYGDIFKIKLGSVNCVVVCKLDNIREVLIVKGDHFDGRPNFQRYSLIFNGDKRNCKFLDFYSKK
ncbi:hypothetical protein PGB90_000166 [Kerria lacca]